MHPAFSVIFFTVFSGLGYGLMALLGVFAAAGWMPREPIVGAAGLGLATAAVTAGLLSSTWHLGHPERALRALSQWRSSWLSREGLLAVATYLPLILLAYCWIYRPEAGTFALWGLLTAVLAVVTIYCTAMIYRSLRPIPEWATSWTVGNYILLGVAGGAVWLVALARVFDVMRAEFAVFAVAALAIAWLAKLAYWRRIDAAVATTTAETATGLGHIGRVRTFEGPHTEANYLLEEMGYRIARKHAGKLRRYAQGLAFLAPALLVAAAAALDGLAGAIPAVAAAALVTAGQLIERWLFFAEARHVVTLFYGKSAA